MQHKKKKKFKKVRFQPKHKFISIAAIGFLFPISDRIQELYTGISDVGKKLISAHR